MTDHRERQIRDRAHQKWQEDGEPQGREMEHWLTAEREILNESGAGDDKLEGEGSYTAAHEYNTRTEKFAKSGKVAAKAKEAREAVDGPEGAELRRAEEVGKRHSKGEDPGALGS